MGNTCSFDSPDLVQYVAIGVGAALTTTIPTFAIAATNAAFLSVAGVFRSQSVNVAVVSGDLTFMTSTGTCQFFTKRTEFQSDSTVTTTARITPYLQGPDGDITYCAVLAPTTTDAQSAKTTYNSISCPSIVLSALPTGTYALGFEDEVDNFNTFARNTFVLTTPLITTTTLQPVPATISTQTEISGTTTSTTTLNPVPTATSLVTEFTRTVTASSTTFPGTSTETRTIFTRTVVSTSVLVAGCRATSTFTAYTGTVTRPSTTTLTFTTCAARRTTCPRGTAPNILSCPAADGTCYTTSSGDVYQLECVDRANYDLSSSTVVDMKACLSLCSSTTGCSGAVYRFASGLCTMKSRSSAATQDPGVIGARLINRGARAAKRGLTSMRAGGNPDFTYPPTPQVFTVTPAPSGTVELSPTTRFGFAPASNQMYLRQS